MHVTIIRTSHFPFIDVIFDNEDDSQKERDENSENTSSKNNNRNFKTNDTKRKDENKELKIGSDLESNNRESFKNINSSFKNKPIKILDQGSPNFSIYLEIIAGKGEDAPPILLEFEDNVNIIGVADGMGGAGSTIYEIGNTRQTGAYIASRVVKSIAENYFINFRKQGYDISKNTKEQVRDDLKHNFSKGLEQILNDVEGKDRTKSIIKSNLIRKLPTTFALSYIQTNEKKINAYNFWAGDSRIYSLDSIEGLQQLTQDDLVSKGDAFDNLYEDSRISNSINADSYFKINLNSFELNKPRIIFAATDGAFGYLQTPAHFEFLLLDTLENSQKYSEWEEKLIREFKKRQSDDISLSFSFIGYKDFSDVKNNYKKRYQALIKDITNLPSVSKEITLLENSLKDIQHKNDKVKEQILDFENQIKSVTDKSSYLEREINSYEYEIKKRENRIEEKKKEIRDIEKEIDSIKKSFSKNSIEFNNLRIDIDAIKNKSMDYMNNNKLIDTEPLLKELKAKKERTIRANKELWLKYKRLYEKYL